MADGAPGMTTNPKRGGSLSPREIDVIIAASRGATNPQIARQLRVSESTVKTHLWFAGIKLGASGRAGVVGAAFRAGVIT
mgnify:CR=1 FL=1